jgi:hypothetical protein
MKGQHRPRKLKTKIHFNRINMQRKDPRIWSAHNSHGCHMSEQIKVVHNGQVILETVYKPEATQPRAYLLAHGTVREENGVTIVEV